MWGWGTSHTQDVGWGGGLHLPAWAEETQRGVGTAQRKRARFVPSLSLAGTRDSSCEVSVTLDGGRDPQDTAQGLGWGWRAVRVLPCCSRGCSPALVWPQHGVNVSWTLQNRIWGVPTPGWVPGQCFPFSPRHLHLLWEPQCNPGAPSVHWGHVPKLQGTVWGWARGYGWGAHRVPHPGLGSPVSPGLQ